MFYLKKILTTLVLPPTGPLIVAILGLAMLGRWPRLGRTLAWAGVVSLLTFSLPATSAFLMRLAIDVPPFDSADARNAQAIVILGGGQRHAPEYGGATVSEFSLERIRYGAKLARELQLPVLVTGGGVYTDTAEAILMAQALQDSFATNVRWIEPRSRDTRENAQFSAEILQRARIDTVVLVTHDFHQRRGIAEFAAFGIRSYPAPVTSVSAGTGRALPQYFPNAGSLRQSTLALHELLGYLVLAPGRSGMKRLEVGG